MDPDADRLVRQLVTGAEEARRLPPASLSGHALESAYPEAVPLSDRDRELLDFESRWNGHDAAKEEAIRRELEMTPARYYQLLDRVLDAPGAAEYDAMLVHRLRRLREARAKTRATRTAIRTDAAG